MKKLYSLAALVAVMGFAGCGQKEPAAPAVQPSKTQSGTSQPAAAMPSLATPAAQPPPPTPVPAVSATPTPPPGATAVSPKAALANGLVRTVDEEGQVLTAEKILYRAIMLYVEGQGKPWPKDPNELVQAKVLQSLPPAPAGQKWAIDEQQHKVVLVRQ